MRERIGDAGRIEKECARARAAADNISRAVGAVIREVVALWKEDEHEYAQQVVEEALREESHPTLHCLLGQTLGKLGPQNAKAADREFREAYSSSCRRSELVPAWLGVKRVLEDWEGIIQISRYGKGGPNYPQCVAARGEAYAHLSNHAVEWGRYQQGKELALEGARDIQKAFRDGNARGYIDDLKEWKFKLVNTFVDATEKMFWENPDRHLEIFDACHEAVKCWVTTGKILDLGRSRLQSWWLAVSVRPPHGEWPHGPLGKSLSKCSSQINLLLEQPEPRSALISRLKKTRDDLKISLDTYKEIHKRS